MCDNPMSQIISSLLLGCLSLIPNVTLRYTLLAIIVCLAVMRGIHFQRLSTQLRQLKNKVKMAEEILQTAKLYCPMDVLCLTEQGVQLLEVSRTMSMIRCRILESGHFSWKIYRLLSRDIAACARDVKRIRTAAQLIVEAENQRRYTEDIIATKTMLNPPGIQAFTVQPNLHLAEQSYNIV
ncbi:hypothetical protein DFH07DRAFT_1064270 [Mycena maculata]|uniref:Uncharacterized protein n=1 Tax=Mycena maculata TaxID=230809 RepID=A0AAD7ICZ0_9AGAR|nr:hypothetical protein DFH07DRAFT_1064270 [Mycena maculata]